MYLLFLSSRGRRRRAWTWPQRRARDSRALGECRDWLVGSDCGAFFIRQNQLLGIDDVLHARRSALREGRRLEDGRPRSFQKRVDEVRTGPLLPGAPLQRELQDHGREYHGRLVGDEEGSGGGDCVTV